jgi:hypothetical protein
MHRCIHSSTVGVPLGTTALVADDDNAFPDTAQSSSATAVGAPLPALELSPMMMSFPTPRSDDLPPPPCTEAGRCCHCCRRLCLFRIRLEQQARRLYFVSSTTKYLRKPYCAARPLLPFASAATIVIAEAPAITSSSRLFLRPATATCRLVVALHPLEVRPPSSEREPE